VIDCNPPSRRLSRTLRCLRGARAVAELGEDGLGDGLRLAESGFNCSGLLAYSVGEFFYKSQ
jgi:hypothetical protein